MAKYQIAWLPGDGIGKEVLEAVQIVLDKIQLDAEYIHGDIGWEFWKKEGDPFPMRTIELVKSVNVTMFGAITSKPPKEAEAELPKELQGLGIQYRSPIVRLRQLLDLYICQRPCKAYPGNPLNYKENIDIVVFRENTEDLYVGVEYSPVPPELSEALAAANKSFLPYKTLSGDQYALSCKIITRKGSERIIRAAYEHAKKFKRKKVTIAHKANVLRATDGLFLEVGKAIAEEYPSIESENVSIDSLINWLMKSPTNYDVLVAPNLYGSILSDVCSQLVGGLGFSSSGNIGKDKAVFEPVHGSAPKYAGLYKCNPIAGILAAKMMLDFLNEHDKANRIEKAVAAVIAEGKIRTFDMGGNHSTLDMARAIAERV